MIGLWNDVVGQARAISILERAAVHPVHAYLFAGPSGSTKLAAARAFAALLIADSDQPGERDLRLALNGEHPDITEVQRVGTGILAEQAREIVRISSLAPVEGARKILILDEFHLLKPESAAILLKTIEEPPPSTTFIILADIITRELITIASRCARVDFHPISESDVTDRLIAEGTDPRSASEAASAAGGDLSRARVLATDPHLSARRRAFAEAPRSLDGTGSMVMKLADQLTSLLDEAIAPLVARHETEVAELEDRIARMGERGSGRKALEERHKREIRRYRSDDLRQGLAAMARTYRDACVDGTLPRPEAMDHAVSEIHRSISALELNPNEALLMQALLWSLPPLSAGRSGS
jgi:DNA polymerase III subunit delta'